MKKLLLATVVLSLILGSSLTFPQPDNLFRKFRAMDGTTIEFVLITPRQRRATYPVLLALPPGEQTRETVNWGIHNLYGDHARRNGWVVVSPVAPDGRLFFQGSEKYLTELLGSVTKRFPPEGDRFYLAGVSNGGISAFRAATLHPDQFHGVLTMPGYPSLEDRHRLDKMASLPTAMFVGEKDETWVAGAQQAASQLRELGNQRVLLEIVTGEGHSLRSLYGGARVFEVLQTFRPGSRSAVK